MQKQTDHAKNKKNKTKKQLSSGKAKIFSPRYLNVWSELLVNELPCRVPFVIFKLVYIFQSAVSKCLESLGDVRLQSMQEETILPKKQIICTMASVKGT